MSIVWYQRKASLARVLENLEIVADLEAAVPQSVIMNDTLLSGQKIGAVSGSLFSC